jgi:ketosteroid isomerase-like protein
MSQENVERAQEIYEAFASWDMDRVVAAFDPDIEWVEPSTPGLPEGGTHRGADAVVREVFETAAESWEAIDVVPSTFYDAGDVVVATGAFRGRSKRGGELDVPFAHVLHIRGGKLARFEAYFDTASYLQAMRGES